MDLQRPLAVITPTLDGDVLMVLAAAEVNLTGRDIGRRVGASQEGVRQVLDRLRRQGIVLRERVGNAHAYRLNRGHIAASSIERLASLRSELIQRLRGIIGAWRARPAAAALFGSAARGEANAQSDIDILIIRPAGMDPDRPAWRRQLMDLESLTTELTGNDARILEYSADEVRRLKGAEKVLASAAEEGIELYGSLRRLPLKKPRR